MYIACEVKKDEDEDTGVERDENEVMRGKANEDEKKKIKQYEDDKMSNLLLRKPVYIRYKMWQGMQCAAKRFLREICILTVGKWYCLFQ